MTPETALTALRALADPIKAAEMAAYHKAEREYLGVAVPEIDALAKAWRDEIDANGRDIETRVALAAGLWDTNIHEARIAAAKLLTQARIRDDAAVWALIASWVPQFDGWALADAVATAGGKRLVADPSRLDEVETWVTSEHMWSRRAALVFTLPWTKQNFPTDADRAIRKRVLGWCETLAVDKDWFIQKAIGWWVRDLSKHDAELAQGFLDAHGDTLKPFAKNEAARYL